MLLQNVPALGVNRATKSYRFEHKQNNNVFDTHAVIIDSLAVRWRIITESTFGH